MALIDNIEITDQDRKAFPWADNDSTRQAWKHILCQSNERLRALVKFNERGRFDLDNPEFVKFKEDFGPNTNPQWIVAELAQAAVSNDVITEDQYEVLVG